MGGLAVFSNTLFPRHLLTGDACLVFLCRPQQMSVEQMAKATRGLPEFQELSKKMSQHVRLSQECMDKVRRAAGMIASCVTSLCQSACC